MYKLIIIGTILTVVTSHIHPINEYVFQQIKERATTWIPMEIEQNPLHHKTLQQIKGLLGAIVDRDDLSVPETDIDVEINGGFDCRTAWPGCCANPIQDQASCGSCWAFASSEVVSDRFCIATQGKTNIPFSAQDLVSCDEKANACEASYADDAFDYIAITGVVSDACMPYTSGKGDVAACPTKCTGTGTWKKYKCVAGSKVASRTITNIQKQIQTNGPVETTFNIYSDFMHYKGGIYQHVSGYLEGGHSVKIIGWGTESGLNYWICANSWGPSWGENGFFRIAFGECNIDSYILGCTPDLTA